MEDIKDSSVKRFCSKNLLVILGFSFILAVIALIAVGLTQNKPLPENVKYGIVLDAGSSHTSLYIYKWPAEKENDTGVVYQIEECKVQGPGISKYAQKIQEIGVYLTECMRRAKQVIPKSQHQETPVYLGATAGMRLLRMESEKLADQVLDAVTKSLSSYPFDFQGAKIITGEEEGAYGWITVNYLLGKFTQKLGWFNLIIEENGQETFGALDLGGASTQITFVPQDDIESPANALQFRLYGKDYSVYTHSFLCYGKDQALWQKLAKDIQASFQIQGTGNYQQCQQSILGIFNTSDCPYSQCSFNGIFLPPIRGKFQAFSAFYYVMNFFNLTSEKVSQEKAIDVMEKFCSKPWVEVKTTFDRIKEKYLSEYCFSGAYILSLLLHGYHFTAENWANTRFKEKIRNTDAGWSLGYMLNLTNLIPAEQPFSTPLSHSIYVFLMVLFSLILVAVLIIGFIVFHTPSCFWKDVV
ncbi:ectonucleoside triphosphate diphosphohydrolase 1 isoform X3 [Choloepus didactylus]|uniref:ectonucleoside triphosphate diphosphohydrolase 1 isoform X3 n=1 Tax=Choloepus didactylus TaxID=27675 RepID=UPI00189EF443|nr:ectonucleoside triphosphate diphosphohydrolase 1 isoform X3 [Choloepus didactylus]